MLFSTEYANYLYNVKPSSSCAKSKEEEELENSINQKILDSIIDDDEKKFIDLIYENCNDPSKANKVFRMSNYKFPHMMKFNPTYASLCAYFSSEKCFTALLNVFPEGILSEELKKLDDFKRSPIHFACFSGNLKIIRELEQANFDMNAKDIFGYHGSHYAAMSDQCDVIKYLYSKSCDVTSQCKATNMTPLQVACLCGSLEVVKFIYQVVLKNQKQNESLKDRLFFAYSSRNEKETTPLHYACIGGHDDIVKFIISNPSLCGSQKDSMNTDLRTPLLCACFYGSLNCVKALLTEKNMKLDMKNKKHLALVDASAGGYLDIVKYLLMNNEIDIHRETSENISALQAAVMNNHLDVVKYLVDLGAAKYVKREKIGHIMFHACKTENIDMIRYLDKVFNEVPYNDKYQIEPTSTRSNYKYREAVRKNESKSLTFGDMYMQQSCLFRNKKMINFFLEKNCNFNNLDVSKVIQCKAFRFLKFLIQKGFDINCSKNPSIELPIVTIMRFKNIDLIKHFISLGALLNGEIILKCKCIQLACKCGSFELFNYLMSFKPELKEDDIKSSLNSVFSNFSLSKYGKENDEENECLKIVDSLLSIQEIDMNSSIYKDGSSTFVSIAAENRNIKLLELFEKHGTDFTDSALNFNEMIDEKFMPVYNYLKEHGCQFKKRVAKYGYTSNYRHTCPLLKLLSVYIKYGYEKPDVLVFMLDFATPKQIIESEFHNKNLIDIFMKSNYYNGVLKAFSITKSIFYPKSSSVEQFEQWILQSNDQNLIDFIYNSGLQPAKEDEDFEEYENTEEEDFY